ncbi:MAG: hypothetical protein ACKODX_00405, partial [Gemmata sp.]
MLNAAIKRDTARINYLLTRLLGLPAVAAKASDALAAALKDCGTVLRATLNTRYEPQYRALLARQAVDAATLRDWLRDGVPRPTEAVWRALRDWESGMAVLDNDPPSAAERAVPGGAGVLRQDADRPITGKPTRPARRPTGRSKAKGRSRRPDAKPDGPFDADGFRFAGVDVRFGKAGKQYLLVMALWDAKKKAPAAPRPVEDVIAEVWGDENE